MSGSSYSRVRLPCQLEVPASIPAGRPRRRRAIPSFTRRVSFGTNRTGRIGHAPRPSVRDGRIGANRANRTRTCAVSPANRTRTAPSVRDVTALHGCRSIEEGCPRDASSEPSQSPCSHQGRRGRGAALQRHSHGGPWERGERPKGLHLSDCRRNLLAARLSYCPACPITLRGSPRHYPNTLPKKALELNACRRIEHGVGGACRALYNLEKEEVEGIDPRT